LLTLSTLGPASYLVYKHGGGFDYSDTKLALGLYGANLIFAAAAMPLTKLRNLKGVIFFIFKVHKTAGSLILPYSLWISFYTVLLYFMKSEEPKKN
uniref:Cytochrome b n=1 Tax=Dracunculus medinensis TaxID=318479 RepID=A0A0N4UP85_DRAME